MRKIKTRSKIADTDWEAVLGWIHESMGKEVFMTSDLMANSGWAKVVPELKRMSNPTSRAKCMGRALNRLVGRKSKNGFRLKRTGTKRPRKYILVKVGGRRKGAGRKPVQKPRGNGEVETYKRAVQARFVLEGWQINQIDQMLNDIDEMYKSIL